METKNCEVVQRCCYGWSGVDWPPTVRGFQLNNRCDVTADGQRFLINAPAEATGQAPFNVILNSASTLKK